MLIVIIVLTLYIRAYSDMYLAAGEYLKAVEIMGENGWIEKYEQNMCIMIPLSM